jgi:hypothetical protein
MRERVIHLGRDDAEAAGGTLTDLPRMAFEIPIPLPLGAEDASIAQRGKSWFFQDRARTLMAWERPWREPLRQHA